MQHVFPFPIDVVRPLPGLLAQRLLCGDWMLFVFKHSDYKNVCATNDILYELQWKQAKASSEGRVSKHAAGEH